MKGISADSVLDVHHRMAACQVNQAAPVAKPEAAGSAQAAAGPAAHVAISGSAKELSLEAAGGAFDMAKVEALKSRIASGNFKVDAHEIARNMLDELG